MADNRKDLTKEQKENEAISKALEAHPVPKNNEELYPNLNNERLKLKDENKPKALVKDRAKQEEQVQKDQDKQPDQK